MKEPVCDKFLNMGQSLQKKSKKKWDSFYTKRINFKTKILNTLAPCFLKIAISMRDNGKINLEMVRANKSGKMAQSMRATGKII